MILLYNVNVVDGSGEKPYLATLVLQANSFKNKEENKILKIIKQSSIIRNDNDIILSYKDTDAINFDGDFLIPSFIDAHCHSEMLYLKEPDTSFRRDDYISQEIVGNCGISLYPVSKDKNKQELLKKNVLSILGTWPSDIDSWQSFGDFKAFFDKNKPVNKLYFQVGHSALRIAAMDNNTGRAASKNEVAIMCKLLDESLNEGCIGFSTGLYYEPCVFATDYEILELLNVLKSHDKVFSIHRRQEGNEGLEATKEAINFAKKASVKLQISHLKAIGDKNQNQVDKILSLIDRAFEEGLDIAFDQYPYTFGSTSLSSLLPPSVLAEGQASWVKKLKDNNYRKDVIKKIEGSENYDSIIELCGFDNIFIQSCDNKRFVNKSISELAGEDGVNVYDMFFDILISQSGPILMRDTTQTEESLVKIMSHPLSIYGTDALYAGDNWHPRSTESTRFMLKNYSKEVGIEKLVNRATEKTAKRFGLEGDFCIKEGASPVLIRLSKKEF